MQKRKTILMAKKKSKIVRVDIKLPEKIAEAIEAKAKTFNHSRTSYIEWLCMKDVGELNDGLKA